MAFGGLLNPQKIGDLELVIGHKLVMSKKPLEKEENQPFWNTGDVTRQHQLYDINRIGFLNSEWLSFYLLSFYL